MRMLARGGNAIDAGVAAVFAAGVSEISHFGLGGEVPVIVYLADRKEARVISGQGPAPATATIEFFRGRRGIPGNGPLAGSVPAVVDALCIALAEFGTLSLADALGPAVELADGFPWYDFLTFYLRPEIERMAAYPSATRVYLPEGRIPAIGSIFRQPDLAGTLRALVEAERQNVQRGRKGAIHAARDRFYRGDIGRRIAAAVRADGGLLSETDLAAYQGRIEHPTRGAFRTRHGAYEIFKTGFWGQGPVLVQTLALLQGFDLERMGHNSTEYIHTVTEALKLALADRDEFYGDPDFAKVPTIGLLSEAYAKSRSIPWRRTTRRVPAIRGDSSRPRVYRAARILWSPAYHETMRRPLGRSTRRRSTSPTPVATSFLPRHPRPGSRAARSSRATQACRSATACKPLSWTRSTRTSCGRESARARR